MDEIITRWASDLTKYQKEFQDQASKVAAWDRLLVENGDKVQKLYMNTFEAERSTAEVEKQLATVENNQNELEAWLDHYEREVDEIYNRTGGPGDSLQGPDQERERTYKLAETLGDRLDEMGKDLTSMIQEINTASTSLSKSTKADDPVSTVLCWAPTEADIFVVAADCKGSQWAPGAAAVDRPERGVAAGQGGGGAQGRAGFGR